MFNMFNMFKKNYFLYFLGGLILIGVFGLIGLLPVDAALFRGYRTSMATSTTAALDVGTTYETPWISMLNGEAIEMKYCLTADSVSTVFNFTIWFNDDDTGFGDTYFGEDNVTVDSLMAITHSSSTPIHSWSPEMAGYQLGMCKSTLIDPNYNDKVLIRYYATGANGDIWLAVKPVKIRS